MKFGAIFLEEIEIVLSLEGLPEAYQVEKRGKSALETTWVMPRNICNVPIPCAILIFCLIWLFVSNVKMEFSWILNSNIKEIVSYSRDQDQHYTFHMLHFTTNEQLYDLTPSRVFK